MPLLRITGIGRGATGRYALASVGQGPACGLAANLVPKGGAGHCRQALDTRATESVSKPSEPQVNVAVERRSQSGLRTHGARLPESISTRGGFRRSAIPTRP